MKIRRLLISDRMEQVELAEVQMQRNGASTCLMIICEMYPDRRRFRNCWIAGNRWRPAIAGLESGSNPWDRVRVEVRWRV